MTVGLPGTGIGGIFYILLALLLPIREVWLTITGRSSPARWRRLVTPVFLSAGIMTVLVGESMLLLAAFRRLSQWFAPGSTVQRASTIALNGIAPWVAATPFVILGVLIAATPLLRLFVSRRRGKMTSPGGATALPVPPENSVVHDSEGLTVLTESRLSR
jgi:hypothetical protein